MAGKPTVLLLGTFHMRPTADMYSMKVDDLLSDTRQQEIMEVVERIKAFKPTKIALEAETKKNDAINQQYLLYRSGKFELQVNEIHQLGFRLAADLAHERLFCIDWMEKGAGTKGAGEVYEWARENQPDLFESIFGRLQKVNGSSKIEAYKSILEMYRECNEPSSVKSYHTMYINFARIGETDQYVGMEWLIWWYQRNLILFANLARLAASGSERILLIVGGSHVQILTHFLNECGLVEVESAFDYLK